MWLRVGAELLGSFLVCFVIYMAYTLSAPLYNPNLAFIALATGFAYAVVTFVFGRISGGQLNPAVTVAAMLTSKTRPLDGVLYIIVQVLGGIAAGAVYKSVLPSSQSLPIKIWLTYGVNGFESGSVSYSALNGAGTSFGITVAILVEVVAGILIIATAMSTIGADGAGTSRQPWAMGIAYAAGAALTYPITGAALNPARSTGIAIFAQNQGLTQQPLQQLWVFWIVPVLAAALVALVMVARELFANGSAIEGAAFENDIAEEDAAEDSTAEEESDDALVFTTGNGGEAVDANAGDAADQPVSVEQTNAGVGNDQAEPQSNTDNGIEGD
ncbi:MIP/aquaporin family protein [Bifidobacterium sp.]|uniref:MIP/aquaporin family protein n=1 Tax=Bifidobacterium sp. TaxID=41200 RepID=UPI0025B7B10A|nr:aquaporin [Bifidobacterium sp.]MCH4208547.1 aquaporin [Bifidobacterium sp.]MCI1224233.1 aquaporin [Bifidobacterium sp.]